jgi:hypothetical protein
MEPITNPICQLSNEADDNYDLFQIFLKYGTIKALHTRIQGKISMSKLYYLAKRFNWNERRLTASHEVLTNIVDYKIKDLIWLHPQSVQNTIDSACALERITAVVLICLPTDFNSISERISIDPVKILRYANNFNTFVKNYTSNQKKLNDKLLEIGINIKNLNPIIENLNFGQEFENIINNFSTEEIAVFESELKLKQNKLELTELGLQIELQTREITPEQQDKIINHFKEPEPDWDAFYKELDADDLAYEKKRKNISA